MVRIFESQIFSTYDTGSKPFLISSSSSTVLITEAKKYEYKRKIKSIIISENNNIDWSNNSKDFLNEFLHEGSQVKNIWIPYGE